MAQDPMEIINQRNAEVERIRGYGDLTQEAKDRRITEVNERAKAEYQEAREAEQREIADRLERAEKELFAFRYPLTASDTEKAQIRALRRRAYDDVYYSVAFSESPQETDEELERLLVRAERTGDPELADAVYHIATEKGARKVADAYLEKRPAEKRRWEEYAAARSEAERSRGFEGIFQRGLADKAMNSPEFTRG